MRKHEFESKYDRLYQNHIEMRNDIIGAYKQKVYGLEEAQYELQETNTYTLGQLIGLCADHLGYDNAGVSLACDTTLGAYD